MLALWNAPVPSGSPQETILLPVYTWRTPGLNVRHDQVITLFIRSLNHVILMKLFGLMEYHGYVKYGSVGEVTT